MADPTLHDQSSGSEKRGSITHEEDLETSHAVDPKEDARIMRKVDWRLIPILSILYSVSLIDRTNISVARLAGMAAKEPVGLNLVVGERYSIISLIFFVPYIIFELPSNILLRKLGARNHITAIVLMWGAVMTGMGFVKNWHQLLALRAVLGVFEAGFFPACLFLITCWYKRYETQRRLAAFYGLSQLISGFSNIMGYGISLLKGRNGLAGWRWVFIVYGAVTMGLGILAFLLVVDFPDKATFLTPAEAKIVKDRIDLDRGDAVPDVIDGRAILKNLGDLKLWAFGLIFLSSTVPAYAFAYFLPVILGGGGYSVRLSLILSAPPYVGAFFWVLTSATLADKTKKRALWICVNCLVCLVGLIMMGWGGKLGVRYAGSFLAIAGCQANVPAAAAYQANNIVSYSARAVGSALLVGLGGVGGIIASLVYRQADYPKYIPGISATIGFQCLILTLCGVLSLYFRKKNREADEGTAVLEGKPGFRYTI
ncbi:hypothetical protein RQP46_011509 [Phenoliferia psychrophenolica]